MRILPIIFQPEMVRALLAGRKTQTRRLRYPALKIENGDKPLREAPLARVKAGDVLYVRENFALRGTLAAVKIAEAVNMVRALPGMEDSVVYFADADGYDEATQGWLPSIHLPRFFSRLTLAVTEVRFQRLQEISNADCIAEGAEVERVPGGPDWEPMTRVKGRSWNHQTVRLWYHRLFDEINGPGAWDANPEVVALTFTVHKQNVDEFLRAGAANGTA